MSKKQLDIDNWARKEHFHFFKQFTEPFHSVVINVDCTNAYRFVKANGFSFYLYTIYVALKAAQEVESFRYRIEDGGVSVYDQVAASATIGRADGTFGFSFIEYYPGLEEFMQRATAEAKRVQEGSGLELRPRNDLILISTLPWLNFTSLTHATSFRPEDSCPRITFGKMTENYGKRSMPMAIHVNHALCDGLHVGLYAEAFQRLLDEGQLNNIV
ncbi:chloramphenicol acetyltransferase [Mucilaginibacter sp. RS28]|uniref:Chloramphenicol acetyltransferase n=1 Tax=Mucilaginibacter straminoryzae TaxID=2932774 RepID=A0A9X2BBF4_9SPHI|nr:chloramphenicol acetyltransferase [Mucilaginibacter straminoryzae]MCJ8208143.1 chloramphenicol acetyltransferase [Mucilaginibacter straminoryzae]